MKVCEDKPLCIKTVVRNQDVKDDKQRSFLVNVHLTKCTWYFKDYRVHSCTFVPVDIARPSIGCDRYYERVKWKQIRNRWYMRMEQNRSGWQPCENKDGRTDKQTIVPCRTFTTRIRTNTIVPWSSAGGAARSLVEGGSSEFELFFGLSAVSVRSRLCLCELSYSM